MGKALGKISAETAKYIENEAKKLAPDFERLTATFGGAEIAEAAKADKKNVGGGISVMLAENHIASEVVLTKEELEKELNEWKSSL